MRINTWMLLLGLVPGLVGFAPTFKFKTETIGVVNVGVETPLDVQWRDRLGVRVGYTYVDALIPHNSERSIPILWSGVALGGIVGSEDDLQRGYLVATAGLMPLGVELGPYVQDGPEGLGGGILGGATLTSGVVAIYGRYGLSTDAHQFAEAGLRLNVPVPVRRHKGGSPFKWAHDAKLSRERKRRAAAREKVESAAFNRLEIAHWTMHRKEGANRAGQSPYPVALAIQMATPGLGAQGQGVSVHVIAKGRDRAGRVYVSRETREEAYRKWHAGHNKIYKLAEAPVVIFMERDAASWEGDMDFQLEDLEHWTITARRVRGSNRFSSSSAPVVVEELVWTTEPGACQPTPTRRCMALKPPRRVESGSEIKRDWLR